MLGVLIDSVILFGAKPAPCKGQGFGEEFRVVEVHLSLDNGTHFSKRRHNLRNRVEILACVVAYETVPRFYESGELSGHERCISHLIGTVSPSASI